jgi:hypothetical protein
VLARAAWLAASALLLTASPGVGVDSVQHALGSLAGSPAEGDVALPAPPVPLPVAPRVTASADLAPLVHAEVSIGVVGASGGAPARDSAGRNATRMVAPGASGLNAASEAAAVVAQQLRDERDAGVPFRLARVDGALGAWRSAEKPDRLLVGRGELTARDAHGARTSCGLAAAAMYAVWGDHLRLAVRALDANPRCPPLSSSAPRGLLHADGAALVSDVLGAHGQEQVLRVEPGEGGVTLDESVILGDGSSYAFHGTLQQLPVEPADQLG